MSSTSVASGCWFARRVALVAVVYRTWPKGESGPVATSTGEVTVGGIGCWDGQPDSLDSVHLSNAQPTPMSTPDT
jgi:hypothetical protein